jgi:Skp family chaperone for outer membrane proteins
MRAETDEIVKVGATSDRQIHAAHCGPTMNVGRAMWSMLVALWMAATIETAQAEPASVAVVDVEQAFQRSPLVLAMAAQLNTRFESRKRELGARMRRLAELRNLQARVSDSDLAKLSDQVREESRALGLALERYRLDLEAAQKSEGELLLERVAQVAAGVAREKGLTLIVKRNGVPPASGQEGELLDITDDVTRALVRQAQPAAPRSAPAPSRP